MNAFAAHILAALVECGTNPHYIDIHAAPMVYGDVAVTVTITYPTRLDNPTLSTPAVQIAPVVLNAVTFTLLFDEKLGPMFFAGYIRAMLVNYPHALVKGVASV